MWVPKCLNADKNRQRCQSSEQILDFISAHSKWIPVAIGDHGRNLVISLWPGDKVTIYGLAALWLTPPQKFQVQKSAGNVLASIRFFWNQDDILLIDYLTKGHTINAEYCSLHFEVKTPRKVHKSSLLLARQCRGSPGTCSPEETGLPWLPVSWSPTLFSGFGPVGLPTVRWTEKTFERSPYFVWRGGNCRRGDLVGQTTFWYFFEWLAKVRATG